MNGDLAGLIDINIIKNYLKLYTEESQLKIINYLIDTYKSTDLYKRAVAMNFEYYEFTTCEEVYDLTGIEYVKVDDKNKSSISNTYRLRGNSDMLLTLPHFICLYPENNNYLFEINSLGNLRVKDIRSNYIEYNAFNLVDDYKVYTVPNALNFTYDLTYLIDMNVNFEDNLRFEYLQANISEFSMNYIGESVDDIAVMLDFISEDKNCVDFNNYSLNIDVVDYHTLMKDDAFDVLKDCKNIFKEVYFNISFIDIGTFINELGNEFFAYFVSFMKENGIKCRSCNDNNAISLLKSLLEITEV